MSLPLRLLFSGLVKRWRNPRFKFLVLYANIRLGGLRLIVTNTQAWQATATMATKKKFYDIGHSWSWNIGTSVFPGRRPCWRRTWSLSRNTSRLNFLVELGFSSNGNLWWTDKQSSGLTLEQTALQSSSSNFQRNNWQKVQFNTDLLKQRHRYLDR